MSDKPLNCACRIDPETKSLSSECGFHMFWLQGKVDRRVEEMADYLDAALKKIHEDFWKTFNVSMIRPGWPGSSRDLIRPSDENVR